ncbi:zinc ribbon domain-containing protein [Gaoshiqia sediminis]|uniref:Zinc ribbon domain-containing protein n=1 Tax=Gaoshiqia sediminis TaxID=2986998 RepID=A0AA42C9C7_9BACT|nr:zinc ribbon domain-containing protein [Gaoshiqia sediminis]MCW0481970.1 zinc ribbon domain-containing protein [Gaoshiqia sediminis]
MKQTYQCPKCGGRKVEVDRIRTTGDGFTRFFNIQNRRFTAVSCSACGYTEFYKGSPSGKMSDVFDFLTN